MKGLRKWLFLALFACFTMACGDDAAIGDACDTAGAEDECEDGAVCTNESGDNAVCRKLCEDQTDCADTEACNGISGSNLKSCQPN